jgi:hypothetical protein
MASLAHCHRIRHASLETRRPRTSGPTDGASMPNGGLGWQVEINLDMNTLRALAGEPVVIWVPDYGLSDTKFVAP